MKKVLLLGASGNIGTQVLDILEKDPLSFSLVGISIGKRIEKIEGILKRFPSVSFLCLERREDVPSFKEKYPNLTFFAGEDGLLDLIRESNADMVVNALVGFVGLLPSIETLEENKILCLANKESLVTGGEKINRLLAHGKGKLYPIDSEHVALAKCLSKVNRNDVDKLIITASGGSFRKKKRSELENVTSEDALKHPTWSMGKKITIDSATMFNKGFEVIEAKWLFGVPAEKIQVLIHPQSIVHSAVQFCDGSVKAQLGVPDMRLPIQYAFSFPKRLHLNGKRLDLFQQHLEFFEPDVSKFKCLAMAYEALHKGGNMPCIVNAANEIVNEGFRKGKCSFLQMGDIIERTMQQATFEKHPNYDVYIDTDAEARAIATEIMNKK